VVGESAFWSRRTDPATESDDHPRRFRYCEATGEAVAGNVSSSIEGGEAGLFTLWGLLGYGGEADADAEEENDSLRELCTTKERHPHYFRTEVLGEPADEDEVGALRRRRRVAAVASTRAAAGKGEL